MSQRSQFSAGNESENLSKERVYLEKRNQEARAKAEITMKKQIEDIQKHKRMQEPSGLGQIFKVNNQDIKD